MDNFTRLAENLGKNNIDVVFARDKEEARDIVRNMLFPGAVISSGGSVSLAECGIIELLKDKHYNYLDRNRPDMTESEKAAIFKNILSADFYFCSSNAVTLDGELINVDGFCNRISAIAFGPKKVVMVVGKNKIVENAAEGFLRIKRIAAPLNTKRLLLDTPCSKLGHCVSLEKCDNPAMTDGCNSKNRICRNYLVSAMQREKGRLTVILVDDVLGY